MQIDALEKAKQKVGGSTALARLLGGITSQAVSQWRRVPVARVLDVERVTGIHRHDLRPDIYPNDKRRPT
jgi:DNA-binding transcriptional regulator YdaS (Cro superfamily)